MTAKLIPSAAIEGTAAIPAPRTDDKTSFKDRDAAMNKRSANKPPPSVCADCQQEPWISIFFDGTGNNKDADRPKRKHSNVVRLLDAHKPDSEVTGFHAIYIAGIGTYDRDISDTYDGMVGMAGKFGMGMASRGEARLKEAMEKYDEVIKSAVARATNPVNKIRMIHLALFGFSRGAALARAFARRIQELCEPDGCGRMQTKVGQYPIEIYFMGLFDTVASVGTPPAAKNLLRHQREMCEQPWNKYVPVTAGVCAMIEAADVYISAADGHVAWGGDMAIPDHSMVMHCEHMVAGHEFRNSFPLDAVLENGVYPRNCRESVYPGAHSNVGGGYRPGEAGKSDTEGELMSQLPLREMHRIAIVHGVPLFRLDDKELGPALQGFVLDPTLVKRFSHYLKSIGNITKPLPDTYLAHMSMYFRWRIIHVGRMLLAQKTGTQTDEEKKLALINAKIEIETAEKTKEVDAAAKVRDSANDAYRQAVWAISPTERDKYETLAEFKKQEDVYYTRHQELEQIPSTSKLGKNLRIHDQEFLDDSQKILRADPNKLSRYQRIIFAAWKMPALNDPELIAFFDHYVHHSHSGFAADMTHAIDPRILYQGGDSRIDLVQTNPEKSDEQLA